jgi:PAS domain S-box-containing protein
MSNDQRIQALEKKIRSLERELKKLHDEKRPARKDREIYASVFHALTDAIIRYDTRKCRIQEANDTAIEMFGYSREELLDMTILHLCGGKSTSKQERVLKILHKAEKARTLVFDLQISLKSRGHVWVELNVLPADKETTSRIAILRDISRYRKQQVELAESRMNLELVINNIPQRIFWKDLDLNYLGCNRWFALDGGLSSSKEIVGMNDYELGWRDQADMYRKDDKQVITSGKPKLNYEEPQTTPDGGTIWLRTNKIPFTNYEGEIVGVLGTYENITKEKIIQQQLRLSEERLMMALEAARYYFFNLNMPDDSFEVGGDFLQSLGYPPSRKLFTLAEYIRLLNPDDMESVVQEYHRHVEKKLGTFYLEFRLRDAHGQWTWFSTSGKVLEFTKDGEPIRITGLLTNINDKKEAQEAIRRINAELEKRVEERTLQLREAMKEMEDFSYSVSHDLRAPLRHIDGFSQMLKEKAGSSLDDVSKKYLDNILLSTRRMSRLIDDLLVYSRAGRTEINKIRFDLGKMFREVISDQATEEENRKIDWKVDALGEIYADPSLFRQVVENLVSNALKYTRNCAIARIHVGMMPSQEGKIIYFIRDNGAGFNMKYVRKLFNVFQRLHTEDQFEGTGVGLASVRQIIKRHGGKIWAEGEENKGAVFYFSVRET